MRRSSKAGRFALSVTAASFGANASARHKMLRQADHIFGPRGKLCGFAGSTVSTSEKSVLQRAAGRKIGSEERTERPKLGFRHVVPEDGRICHTLELSVYMPGRSCCHRSRKTPVRCPHPSWYAAKRFKPYFLFLYIKLMYTTRLR